jgi:hypothetical protein
MVYLFSYLSFSLLIFYYVRFELSDHDLYPIVMYINFDVEAGTLFHYLKKTPDATNIRHSLNSNYTPLMDIFVRVLQGRMEWKSRKNIEESGEGAAKCTRRLPSLLIKC